MRAAGAIALLLVASMLGACDDGGDPRDLRGEVIASLAQDLVVVRYAEVRARTRELSAAAAALCAAPDAGGLEATRDAWWHAREPWQRTEIVKFGPVEEYPERLGPKMDTWPIDADGIEGLVSGTLELDQAAFDGAGAKLRGYHVVEHLLWSSGDDVEEVVDALQQPQRHCDYLKGAAGDLAENAGRLLQAWQRDWQARLSHPEQADAGGMYATTQDVIDEWVNRMVFTVENVREMKLGEPLGDAAGGEPQLEALESAPSGRSLQDARDALRGVADVWDGASGSDAGAERRGIRALVHDADLVAHIDASISQAQDALRSVPEPLSEAIVQAPQEVIAAQDALRELQVLLQVELSQALSVTITFNDNDGD
ncbi:MAG: imelysin family protein [Myxococcales bacterium]|jgi:predicted lipoprotein